MSWKTDEIKHSYFSKNFLNQESDSNLRLKEVPNNYY